MTTNFPSLSWLDITLSLSRVTQSDLRIIAISQSGIAQPLIGQQCSQSLAGQSITFSWTLNHTRTGNSYSLNSFINDYSTRDKTLFNKSNWSPRLNLSMGWPWWDIVGLFGLIKRRVQRESPKSDLLFLRAGREFNQQELIFGSSHLKVNLFLFSVDIYSLLSLSTSLCSLDTVDCNALEHCTVTPGYRQESWNMTLTRPK